MLLLKEAVFLVLLSGAGGNSKSLTRDRQETISSDSAISFERSDMVRVLVVLTPVL